MNDEINHIWKEHHDQLLAFIRKRTKDSDEAEDILQEVFLKILDKIGSLKDSEKLKSWMFQIARNTIIDHFRQKNLEDKQLPDFVLWEDESENNSSMKNAESWIGLYIDGLPENYKEAVVLSELNGLSISEVAEKLNISYTNARARVHRGRQALKKSLTDCCTFHVDVYGNILDYHRNTNTCKKC